MPSHDEMAKWRREMRNAEAEAEQRRKQAQVVTTAGRARQEALAAGADPALADEIERIVADACDEMGCS